MFYWENSFCFENYLDKPLIGEGGEKTLRSKWGHALAQSKKQKRCGSSLHKRKLGVWEN